MIKLVDILKEDLDNEISKLKAMGYDIVDKYSSGIYTALLLYNPEEDIYEVSLTSNDQEFITFQSQVKKSSESDKAPLASFKNIALKVKEWLNKYGDLVVGSLNRARTYKYNQILSKLGFNVGEISHDPPSINFPESWNFIIYKWSS